MEPTVGDRLSRWLMFKGVRPAALARALVLSRTTISKWMAGTVSPDADRLEAVVKALGITMVDFFGPLPDLHTVPAEAEPEPELGPHPSTGDITRELDIVAMERQRASRDCPACEGTGKVA
jgi:transcriptional regulator with XRE-family HTH domain